MRFLRGWVSSLSASAIFFAALFSTAAHAATPDRISGPITSSQMVALQNHVSPFAQPEHDKGPIESSYALRVTMLFTPTAAQQAALRQLQVEQQDRKSANFHKWLTPEQYADRFGLSQNDIEKVSAWIASQGLKVVYIARGRDSINFSGDASQVQAAFHTQIHRYDLNGQEHFANSTAPMVPAALTGIVGGFRGLHNFVPKRASVLHNANSAIPHPDYTLTTSQGSFTFLAPGDIATIYDISPLYAKSPAIDGTGQKMVVVGQTDIYLADLNFFRTDFGLPTISGCTTNTTTGVITACNTTNFQFVIPTTAIDPGVNSGDLGESDLDIEWAGSVARNAQIIFVTSDLNSNGVFNSTDWAIDNDLAPVISISYGLCEAYSTPPSLATQDLEYQKAATLGISVFAATGDEAAATCDGDVFSNAVTSATLGPSVSYPASSPEVTAVGGTEFNEGTGIYWGATNGTNGASVLTNGPENGYIPELAWNDSTFGVQQGFGLDGTGGGPSNCVNGTGTTTENNFPFVICVAPPNGGFTKPSYQTALTPNDSVRDVPDISFSASNANDPYVVCTAQSETTGTASTSTCVTSIADALTTYNSAFGGTSASTPVAAGMAVLLNQYLNSKGLGNLNSQLYSLFSSSPSAFHDIVAGTDTTSGDEDTSDNIVPCSVGTPTFEPTALQCPSTGSFGYSAGAGYDLVTGLGSIDFNVLFPAWAASLTEFTLVATPGTATLAAGQTVTSTVTLSPVNGFSSAVTYTCSSGVTCTFSPNSPTAATTVTATILVPANTAAGAFNVTITGAAGSVSSTATVALTVTATTETFTLKSGTGSYSVVAGSAASVPITVSSSTGFTSTSAGNTTTALPLTYTCSGLPTEANCNFNPSTTSSLTSITLSLTTAAPSAQLRRPVDRDNGRGRIFYALLLPGLFGIVFVAGSRKTSGRGVRMLGLIVVLGASTLWLGSCGGNSTSGTNSNPGTPAGSYTVTVNATTGGANPIANSLTFTLVVAQ